MEQHQRNIKRCENIIKFIQAKKIELEKQQTKVNNKVVKDEINKQIDKYGKLEAKFTQGLTELIALGE